jgi:hypothetical protein
MDAQLICVGYLQSFILLCPHGATTSGGCDDAAEVRYEKGSTFDTEGLPLSPPPTPQIYLLAGHVKFLKVSLLQPFDYVLSSGSPTRIGSTRSVRHAPLARRLRLSSTRDSIGSDRTRQSPDIQTQCRAMSKSPTMQQTAHISKCCASGSAPCTKANRPRLIGG